ncbi:MAG: GTPase ObgE [Candidatus Hydrogenedentes bacterium]|nr:GTPase ObgE [Candidatus Hydrogenedentota bacterium]
MFVDRVRIKVIGGRGGDGCCSFRREAFVPLGGPDGGDGGHGGDVIIVATSRFTSLTDLRFHPYWKGNRGIHGKGKTLHGRRGKPMMVQVPCGTVIHDFESGDVLCDLMEDGQTFLAGNGGRGGKGNTRFATANNKAPRFAENGEPGEEREYRLELKLIAEVGFVGLPNAGKSTLLSAISAASPKIGAYPFTTITPNLGIVPLSDFRTLAVADIPGIIDGAAEGKGLGHDFLRHIERTQVLLYLIDLGDDDPEETLRTLQNELFKHSEVFQERPYLCALNKIDITENRERCEALRDVFPKVHFISGATGEGIPELIEALWQEVDRLRQEAKDNPEPAPPEHEYTYVAPFEVVPIKSGFRIEGKRPIRAVRMTDFQNSEAVVHLQQVLDKMGIFKALKRMGAQEGQSIFIGDLELEYHPE